MQSKKYWLGFNLVKGIGSSRLRGIYGYFGGDLETAWHAPSHELQQAGLDETTIENLLTNRRRWNLDAALKKLVDSGVRICTIEDPDYPSPLSTIPTPLPMFYIKGELLPQDELALAIVGTRRSTTYGENVTRDLTAALVRAGVTIVSGLALGIDTVASRTALESGGRTIVVLANGIDTIYPSENKRLARAIVEQGAIITEYPPRTPPEGKHFPARNRIISGLALGVLVVEAGERSGALHTAEHALEQGREVFAVPGNITSPSSQGTNRLIQDGARLVANSEDILSELDLSHRLIQTRQIAQEVSPTDEIEQRIVALLEPEPRNINDIAIACGLPIQEVQAKLTILTLKGLVEEVAPMMFDLVRRTH